MRERFLIAGLLGVFVIAGCGEREPTTPTAEEAAPPAVIDPPRRTAPVVPGADTPRLADGLWRIATTTDGREQVVTLCLNQAVQDRVSPFAPIAAGGSCSDTRITRDEGGWAVRAACDMGSGGRVATRGVLNGDFAAAYRLEGRTITAGTAVAHMNGEVAVVTEGRRTGDCPSGMAPGDADMGGFRVNLAAMADGGAD